MNAGACKIWKYLPAAVESSTRPREKLCLILYSMQEGLLTVESVKMSAVEFRHVVRLSECRGYYCTINASSWLSGRRIEMCR